MTTTEKEASAVSLGPVRQAIWNLFAETGKTQSREPTIVEIAALFHQLHRSAVASTVRKDPPRVTSEQLTDAAADFLAQHAAKLLPPEGQMLAKAERLETEARNIRESLRQAKGE